VVVSPHPPRPVSRTPRPPPSRVILLASPATGGDRLRGSGTQMAFLGAFKDFAQKHLQLEKDDVQVPLPGPPDPPPPPNWSRASRNAPTSGVHPRSSPGLAADRLLLLGRRQSGERRVAPASGLCCFGLKQSFRPPEERHPPGGGNPRPPTSARCPSPLPRSLPFALQGCFTKKIFQKCLQGND